MVALCALLLLLIGVPAEASDRKLPVVINTWPFVDANTEGKEELANY